MCEQSTYRRAGEGGFRKSGKFYQEQVEELLAFAKSEFALAVTQKDGATLRQHLDIIWQQTGKKPEQLEIMKCPDLLAHIWYWFLELNQSRQHSEMGAMPISFSEILAWATLSGVSPLPNEIRVLKQLDSVAMASK
jgi:hypothetical protein